MSEYGSLTYVKWTFNGSELTDDAALGATVLPILDTSKLAVYEFIYVEGVSGYSITALDDVASTVTITPGLTSAANAGSPVVPDAGGEPSAGWVAEVTMPDTEAPIEVPLTWTDRLALVEGPVEPPRPVELTDDLSRIVDFPNQTPTIDGGLVDTTGMDISPTDGLPPTVPVGYAAPLVIGGVGAVHVRWEEIPNADPVMYRVHMARNATPLTDGTYEVASGVGTTGAMIRALHDGTLVTRGPLPDTSPDTYTAIVTFEDADSLPTDPVLASPASAPVSPVQINSPDLAMNALDVAHLTFGTAFGDSMNLIGVSADWVRTGVLNAERVSIGSRSTSALANSNMEDPWMSSGSIDTSKFAGWQGSWWEGAAGVISQETTNPIGGTRSMKVTMAGPADGYRVVSKTSVPVVGGQTWSIAASYRASRSITTATAGTELVNLMFHTCDGVGGNKPDDIFTAGVTWQVVESIDTVTGGAIGTLSGMCVVPDGHKQMKVSVHAAPANDGSGYSCDFDEITAEMVSTRFQLVNPVTQTAVAYINEEGDSTFHDGQFTGTLAIDTDTDTFDGVLIKDYLSSLPKGLLQHAQRGVGGTTYAAGTNTLIFSQDLYLDSDRALEFVGFFSGNATVAAMRYNIDVRYTYSASAPPALPTTTSTPIAPNNGLSTYTSSGTSGATEAIEPTYSMPNATAGWYTFSVFLNNTGSGTYTSTGQWALDIMDNGKAVSTNAAYYTGQTAAPKTYVLTKDATTTKWWTGGGTFSGAGDGQWFGNTSSNNDGNRRSIMWFDWNSIRTALTGATVTKVELYLYLFDGGANNNVGIGWSIATGPGSNTLPPGTDWTRQTQTETGWDEGTGRWVTLTGTGLTNWNGTNPLTGYIIGPASNSADSYAAAYRGATHSLHPKVRITYTK